MILNLETTWEESDIRTPLIGLLSMGSDPTSAIEGLAKRKDVGKEAIILKQKNNIIVESINSHFVLAS